MQNSESTNLMLYSLFVDEVESHSNSMLIQFKYLELSINSRNNSSIFSTIKIILLLTGQLSLIFHPSRNKYKKRGTALVKAFNLPDDTDFLSSRKMRDHIAHMDERLEAWHSTSSNKYIVRNCSGPRGVFNGSIFAPDDIFEYYVLDEGKFIFRGDEYDLAALCETAKRLLIKAKEISSYPKSSNEFKEYFSVVS